MTDVEALCNSVQVSSGLLSRFALTGAMNSSGRDQ